MILVLFYLSVSKLNVKIEKKSIWIKFLMKSKMKFKVISLKSEYILFLFTLKIQPENSRSRFQRHFLVLMFKLKTFS